GSGAGPLPPRRSFEEGGRAAAAPARPYAARAPGSPPRSRREDEQGDRLGALLEREDDRPARQQHLRQARRFFSSRGDGLRLQARAGLRSRAKRGNPDSACEERFEYGIPRVWRPSG